MGDMTRRSPTGLLDICGKAAIYTKATRGTPNERCCTLWHLPDGFDWTIINDHAVKMSGWTRTLIVLAPLLSACSGKTNTVTPTPVPGQTTPTPAPAPIPSLVATLVGAGDIADCGNDGGAHAEATAKLLDRMDGMVFTAGDNAYFDATTLDYQNCYAPRWGRHRSRTYPSPGNHEYQVSAAPYFSYFGDRAGPQGGGFYSYTLGNWHIVALNSNIAMISPGSEQYVWLQNDLQANKSTSTARCTLAYWHHPHFTSGPSAGSNGMMANLWKLLYDFGVDVVVNGHDHLYERFAPQDVTGRRDNFGIAEYVVGTGGAPLYDFGPTAPNSLFKLKTYGVLKLTLRDVGWDSVFVEAGTSALMDNSIGNLCH
jgi:acid phosphatase type 7